MRKNRLLVFLLPAMVVLSIAVAYQYGYLEVREEIAAVRQEQQAKSKTLAKYAALIEERPEMEERLALLKKTREAENVKLFEGKTLSVTTAALQETVKGIIMSRGGTVVSERVGKPEDFGKFTIVNTSLDATLPDVRALSDVLYSLETRTPYLVVKELDVRVKMLQKPKELLMKLDVSALTGKGKE